MRSSNLRRDNFSLRRDSIFARRTHVLAVQQLESQAYHAREALGELLDTTRLMISFYVRSNDLIFLRQKSQLGCIEYTENVPTALFLIPLQNGRCLTRDATVVDSPASSYMPSTSSLLSSAAESAAARNRCNHLTSQAS